MEEAIDDLDSRLKIDGIVIIRKKIDKGGDYSEDNLLFHDRDNRLINISQKKQLELQLPRIHQISDLVVSKKIEDHGDVEDSSMRNLLSQSRTRKILRGREESSRRLLIQSRTR